MALTQQQIVDLLASFGPGLISGIGQGGQAAADRAQQLMDLRRQAEQTRYDRRQTARGSLAGFYQNQLSRSRDDALNFAELSPLGAEQALARQMARQRTAPAMAAQFKNASGANPLATAAMRGGPNFLEPFAGEDYQSTVSKDATARSIAERRKALAGVDPNFQFGSMGDYGLPDRGDEVAQYQSSVRDRRQASEMDLQRLLTEQMREASAAQIPGETEATAATATTAKKKPSALRRIVGAALPVAAAFIPGVGPVASALIQAGAGAAGSAIAGGGLKGALTGAAMGGLGAATGGLGSAASRRVAGQGLGSFVQKAILNPRALTQIAGGAIGGGTGAALQAASLGMPGAQQGGRSFDTSFEQQGLPNNMLSTGGSYADMETSPGTSPFDTSFERRNVPGLLPGGGALSTDVGAAPRRRAGAAAAVSPTSLPATAARMFSSRTQLPYSEAMPEATYRPRPDAVFAALSGQYSPEQLAALQAALQRISPPGRFDFNAMMNRPLGPKTLDERFRRFSLSGRSR